jgi:glycosyltransferase involved in cell wall biosynthesis
MTEQGSTKIPNQNSEKLAVVFPLFNEEANIEGVIEDWRKELNSKNAEYILVLINDGSTDSSLSILEALAKKYPKEILVVTQKNAGHGQTCKRGYQVCTSMSDVSWVLQIDSDGQCNPLHFKEFWSKRSSADCIFGKRVKREDGLARTIASQVCLALTSLIAGTFLVDPNVPYRLIKKETLLKAIKVIPEDFKIYNIALCTVLHCDQTARKAYVPISFGKRLKGENSINMWNVLKMGIETTRSLHKLKKNL